MTNQTTLTRREVKFIDVGRFKKSWTVILEYTHGAWTKEIQNQAKVISNELSFVNNKIYAGYHEIGSYEFLD